MATEVGGPVVSVRRFEAQPPSNLELQVDPADVVATTKEEEWVTKKTTELTTTRQIETRVQRQVVLEDGQVVEDSGPVVTTNTTEDTEKQEQESKEHRTLDGDPDPNWATAPGQGGGLVKEVTERTVKTREEVEDRLETEDVVHLGDMSDEAYQAAVTRGEDVRLACGGRKTTTDLASAPTGPRIVHASRKSRKTRDTDDSVAVSEAQPDGRVVTETRRTTEHEEERDDEEPDSEEDRSKSDHQETRKESSHKFIKTKDQELVEYLADGVKIGEEMRYTAENTEGEREGEPQPGWDTLRRTRGVSRHHPAPPPPATTAAAPLDRKDALTRRPLDFDREEETRKAETSKWLEHHFGSESRSSKDSGDEGEDSLPPAGRNTSFINVTMKSRPITGRIVSPVNGVTSTQVNGNTFLPTPSKTSSSNNHSPGGFQRISSPVMNGGPSPSFNNHKSGFSSPPVNGRVFNNGFHPASSSGVSSPVNGTTATPRSFVATVNSSSRVFVSSPESGVSSGANNGYGTGNGANHNGYASGSAANGYGNSSGANGYFHGVTEWSERRNVEEQDSRQTFSSPTSSLQHHRVQVLPTGPDHTFTVKTARATSPYNNFSSRTSPQTRASPPFQSLSSRHRLDAASPTPDSRRQETTRYEYSSFSSPSAVEQRTSPHHQHHSLREGDRGASPAHVNGRHTNGWAEHEEDGYRGYRGPPPQEEPDPDYSPPAQPRKESPEGGSPHSTVNKKLYQRTRFAADIPPPPSQQQQQQQSSRPAGRSKSPGNIIGDSFRKLVGKLRSSSAERKKSKRAAKAAATARRSPSPPTYRQYHAVDGDVGGVMEGEQPIAPPRGVARQLQQSSMERPVVHKYYLGEDPFGGSIYGREREYDGVTPVKRRGHRQRRGSREEDDMNRANVSHVVTTTSTLGRVSKSSSRLLSSSPDYTRTSQTLPRKLHHHQEERTSTTVNGRPAGINVSIVNNVTPAKPARTYRSNLARSQSFNVHQTGGPRSNLYTSNPALNRLGDSPAPLKSPAILASISRSQRDLTATLEDETETPRFSRSTSNLLGGSPVDPKKQIFMEGLADRAPELFKTLHAEDVRQMSPSPTPHIYTSTPVRTSRLVETTTTHTSLRNGHHPSSPLRNGLILDSRNSNGSARSNGRLLDSTAAYTNGHHNGRTALLESSSSFRSSTASNDSDPVRHLSSPYRPVDRVTSPSLYATTTALRAAGEPRVTSPLGYSSSLTTHSPVDGTTTSRSVVRRGSGDDYSETVHIKSKNDDPLRPSETNTVQSFSKKVVPMRGGAGRATEVRESSERTTVTKSSFRGVEPLGGGYTSRNGGVVIAVRPGRK